METALHAPHTNDGGSLRRALQAGVAALGILLAPVVAKAWTVMNLVPDAFTTATYYTGGIPYDQLEAVLQQTPFYSSYLTAAGATVTAGGHLAEFEVGVTAADAVIILPAWGDGGYTTGVPGYTENELAVLSSLLASNVRSLVVGEYDGSCSTMNNQLATLLGGTYLGTVGSEGEDSTQTVTGNTQSLTDGVSQIEFTAASGISGGYSLTDGHSISVWGANHDFLVVLDMNVLFDEKAAGVNARFAQNVVGFLSGSSVPEPATYAVLAGLTLLAWVALRRLRGNRA
jgi:hypothetical protein